ncbi:hypothetical protein MW887_007054 [Aspergillus wentii]|nr:hypothetical protein MW887_007054 [Aspergillus wentii]
MSVSDSDLSSLSSAPPTDDESMAVDEPVGIAKYFKKQESESPPPKRAPSPPHDYILADNPDIAVWEGKNPLHGGRTFATMSPEERLQLLKSLILWSLSSSEAVQAKIKESYKQARHEDDLNQPLSVQPWGRDGLKRRYWLIEGQDDTHFRLYRESNPALKNVTWWSVAGDIPELKAVADKLDEEKSTNSKKLSERINNSIPRFEGAEEKRKRRDYRIARKAQFSRPEPGFSLYEGRTRGKKLKYTYSDDEDLFSDDMPTTRRSTRNASGVSTPGEPAGPKYTASGRQIRSRAGGLYGEALLLGQRGEDESEEETGRPQRNRTTRANGHTDYDMLDEDGDSEGADSNEWQGGEEEEENDFEGDDEEGASGDESVLNDGNQSLVVQLRYGKGKLPSSPNVPGEGPTGQNFEAKDETNEHKSQQEQPASTQTQESVANGPQDTAQESSVSDPKALPTPTEEPKQSLQQNGPNGLTHGDAASANAGIPTNQPAALNGTNEAG